MSFPEKIPYTPLIVIPVLIAVIPVGRRSRFGHPHYQPVEMWKTFGSDVRTTGEKGMISVVTDGKSLEINTFLK